MSTELKRSLTLYGLTMIAIGSTIGSGIFRTPGKIALQMHQPEFVIALWVLGGLVALTGALTFAEMGSMFPGAGGLYVYLREAFGDTAGFLYGWFILFVSTSGSIAALSVVCAEHLLYLTGDQDSGLVIPIAVGITVFLTIVNLFGVKVGGLMANLFTGAKLAGLLLIILVGIFYFRPEISTANAASTFANESPTNWMSAFAAAFVGVLWSYGGFQHASYLAGETQNPQRNVPRAMVLGALIVTLVYVLANVAYMRLLPIETIANSKTVAADAMKTVFSWGGWLMAFLIMLSTFGTTAIYCMSAPRIYYAMAKDGIFFRQLAELHPRWHTPVLAILIQAGWSIVLLLVWGTFGDLIDYVTFMDWIGMALVGASIFVFRKRRPDAERGYRTILYPFTPLLFIVLAGLFIVLQLADNPKNSGAGIAVVLVGWVVYHFFFRRKPAV